MSSTGKTLVVPPRLHTVAALAVLLEKLEQMPHATSSAGAAQYQAVAQRLRDLLAAAPADAHLAALLDVFPAAAEVYENLHYDHSGLVRAPLEAAVAAEQATRDVIARLRRS